MNNYESVIIANPKLNDEEVHTLITKITKLITDAGTIDSIQNLGKKKLAYEVKGNKEGIFIIFYFKAEAEFISELERNCRITEEVLKFIVVKGED